MKNWLKIDFEHNTLIMDRTFAKKCTDTNSEEYAQLQRVRLDYPTFKVTTRHIQKNTQKETYAGLTYAYMEDYILTHETGAKRLEVIDEYEELRLVAECHSKSRRYPAIKRWFLAKYPEITEFGMLKIEAEGKENPKLEVHTPVLKSEDQKDASGF